MLGLTERQLCILHVVKEGIRDKGHCPSIREIGKLVGIRTPNATAEHLKALQRKGYIKREKRSREMSLCEIPIPPLFVRSPSIDRAMEYLKENSETG